LSKTNRKISPVLAGLAVLAVPAFSHVVQAQNYPLIKLGDRGPAVKAAEISLQKLGYYHGAIDSIFGSELLSAVTSFQGHYGLAQDGILGSLTWSKLSAAAGTSMTSNHPASHIPLLKLGSKGPAVVKLQRLLNEYGYHLAADGHFGPLTYSALRNFQASHGLAVDGTAGPSTFTALEHTATHSTASVKLDAPPPKYPPGYLHEGDRGPAVKKLQTELTQLGYSTGGTDGDFGPLTLRAVESFQASQGLPAHGLVGALTWGALSRALADHTTAAPLSNRGSVSPTAAAIVGIAMKYQGYPYVFGGNTPSGFDCSGFVQWVYAQVGIALPRTSFAQWNVGTHVTYDQLQPGDLVFFTTEGVFANHVGIYLGGGEFISATQPGQGVMVQSLGNAFFAQSYDGAVQVVN
jgi:peptidoglycan hydrolase-like protein with peptidoglycan-binding domain